MIKVMMFWQFRISLLFLLAFLVVFLPLRYGKAVTGIILLGCFTITGILDYWYLMEGENYKNPVVLTLIEIIIVQITPFLISEYRDFRAMFVGFTAAAYVLTGNVVSSVLYLAGVNLAVNLICQCLIHLLLLGGLAWKIYESFRESLKNEDLKWGELCMIPAMFYTSVYAMTTWPANIYDQPQNLLGVCCIMVLMVMSYIMIVQLFARQKQDNEMKRSMEYLENYASRLKHEADTVQEKEMEAAVMRHDLKHYSILINSYLEEGKKEEIRELLRELNEHVNETKSVRYCENLSVNGIVAHSAKRAKKLGIRFDVDMELPQKMEINEFELATVISNLLENAVNAASMADEEDKRFVRILAYGVKEQLILNMENGCLQEPQVSKITGFPVSAGSERHGYGMQSVRAFAKKNHAVFDFSVKEKIFSVKMLVKI